MTGFSRVFFCVILVREKNTEKECHCGIAVYTGVSVMTLSYAKKLGDIGEYERFI